MTHGDRERTPPSDTPLDVDALMQDIEARLADGESPGLEPFVDEFSEPTAASGFSLRPEVHESDKPVLGPVVTRGKRLVARATMPMVADLAAQVASAIAAMQLVVDEVMEEQAALRKRIEDLEQERKGT
jgi:hypothetical protein